MAIWILCGHFENIIHYFKLQILTSKGDIGIFRNSKKETTVPMVVEIWESDSNFLNSLLFWDIKGKYVDLTLQEFNFQTEKRLPNNLPIDLFNKVNIICDFCLLIFITNIVSFQEEIILRCISTLHDYSSNCV